MDRRLHGVYRASLGPSSSLVSMCLSAVSKLSSRVSEREMATDLYKILVDHDSGAWSEF